MNMNYKESVDINQKETAEYLGTYEERKLAEFKTQSALKGMDRGTSTTRRK